MKWGNSRHSTRGVGCGWFWRDVVQENGTKMGGKWDEMTVFHSAIARFFPGGSKIFSPGPFVKFSTLHSPTENGNICHSRTLTITAASADAWGTDGVMRRSDGWVEGAEVNSRAALAAQRRGGSHPLGRRTVGQRQSQGGERQIGTLGTARPSTIRPFPPHGWSAPDGLPLLLRKQPIWAAPPSPQNPRYVPTGSQYAGRLPAKSRCRRMGQFRIGATQRHHERARPDCPRASANRES